MQIEFVGGARTVTGSSFILKDDDFTIMVDCGMFQGKRELQDRNALNLIYNPSKIDALVLTHAHIDHSGLIPKLVKDGFYGNIYATKATADLCSVMLPDSGHIQEMDINYVNRRNRKLGRPMEEPLYTVEHAEEALENFVPVEYGTKIQIHPRIHIQFRDAGHILGSAIIEMWIDEGQDSQKKIVFSGDLGPKAQAIIRDPEIITEADYVLVESTYGDRVHKDKKDTYDEFRDIIINAHNSEGNIIIPAFAIERTQEIIYTLGRLLREDEIPEIPVYIDSPLAISATEIFRKNKNCFDDETREVLLSGDSPLNFPSLTMTRSADDSREITEHARGSMIIAASGMCTAGRIKHHLQSNLYRPESSVVFVGYQAEGTLGRRIIDGAQQVRVYGEDVAVNAQIFTLGGFSAHADKEGIIDWLSQIENPDLRVFVVHGEEKSSLSLADEIRERLGYYAYVPKWGEVVDIDSMRSDYAEYGTTDSVDIIAKEMDSLTQAVHTLQDRFSHSMEKDGRIHDLNGLSEDLKDVKEMLYMIIDEI